MKARLNHVPCGTKDMSVLSSGPSSSHCPPCLALWLWQELKTASTALASELLRTRHESEREITALRDDMLELTSRFKAEQVRGPAGAQISQRAKALQSSQAPPDFDRMSMPVWGRAICMREFRARVWRSAQPALHAALRPPAPQERIALLKARLAEEGKARGELEEAHQERLCELHRRLQAEHLLR